jgi:transposase
MPDRPAIPESLDHLPDDPALLKALIRELLATNREQQRRIDQLSHQVDQLTKRLYGPRADRLHPDQASLFDDPPPADTPLSPPENPANSSTESTPASQRRGHGRRTLPTNLKRVTEMVDIPEAEKLAYGGVWIKIDEVVSEQLDYTPSSLFVRQIVRPKYVIRFDDQPDQLRLADLPPQALSRCKAAPGLVADVIVSKLVDHLPLYRQEQRYARQGVSIARSTLCDWMAEAAEVLTPLWQLLKTSVLAAGVVHTDDTPIPVQDPDREHCRTARLWTYVSKGGTVYDATETRSRDGPIDFLRGFQGYLQCDAYAGYDELVRRSKGTVVTVGCWAHVRRKFVEAQKASPREAHEAVARIRQLYDVERTARERNLSDIALSQYRQEQAKPLLDSLAAWLETQRAKAIPRTPLAEAIGYAINQWSTLKVYVGDGRLAIDNNTAERAIKPFAIGRKNWLFFGSDRGGRTLATLASFTATCQQFGIEPWRWLRDTLTQLPLTPIDQLAKLLPSPTH